MAAWTLGLASPLAGCLPELEGPGRVIEAGDPDAVPDPGAGADAPVVQVVPVGPVAAPVVGSDAGTPREETAPATVDDKARITATDAGASPVIPIPPRAPPQVPVEPARPTSSGVDAGASEDRAPDSTPPPAAPGPDAQDVERRLARWESEVDPRTLTKSTFRCGPEQVVAPDGSARVQVCAVRSPNGYSVQAAAILRNDGSGVFDAHVAMALKREDGEALDQASCRLGVGPARWWVCYGATKSAPRGSVQVNGADLNGVALGDSPWL